MDERVCQEVAHRVHLLSRPAWLRILDELRQGEKCVYELQAVLRRPRPYVSQQLRVLRQDGVIERRKEGLFVYYRLADPLVARLLEMTMGPAGVEAGGRWC